MEEVKGVSNDELINKLYFNSEHDYQTLTHNTCNLTKPHVDKLLDYQWIYDDSEENTHPSLYLTTDQKRPDVWRFEGIGWKKNSLGFWNGIEHTHVRKQIHDYNSIYATRDTQQLGVINRMRLQLKMQSDSGANRNVTSDKSILHNYQPIPEYSISGINEDNSADIKCIGQGFMPLTSSCNNTIMIEMLHCPNSSGTIISPTAIVTQFKNEYHGWTITADCDSGHGVLRLMYRNSIQDDEFHLQKSNDLWYHSGFLPTSNNLQCKPTVKALSDAASYELWHQRLAHPGQNIMQNIHKYVIGIPKLRGNAFYKCSSCMSAKISKRSIGSSNPTHNKPSINTVVKQDDSQLGQHFSMDFGFMRSSSYRDKNELGKTITSIDGYNSYLLIIERKSRFIWIFLTSSKFPPVSAAKSILEKFKSKNTHRTVRTDQGGELGKSDDFREMISDCGFSLEITGSDASAQNGLAENPNKSLAMMVRCLLYSSEMEAKYWSYALIHATYIKNRLPHATIGITPYEAFTGKRPDLSRLLIFGSIVYGRKPGRRPAKLDKHDSVGIFLGYTATEKNVRFRDLHSHIIKTATHVFYDEAYMSLPAQRAPLAAQTLQRLGYGYKEQWIVTESAKKQVLIQLLLPHSKIPLKSTDSSIGYDLFSSSNDPITILPNQLQIIPTGIALQCPMGTYARIAPRSGMTTKKMLDVRGGVIDPDYRGELKVILFNFGKDQQTIHLHDKIAQIIFERAQTPEIILSPNLVPKKRGKQDFGSTDKADIQLPIALDTQHSAAAAATLNLSLETPFDLDYSFNPIDNELTREIKVYGTHPTLGMKIMLCPHRNLPQLIECEQSTPAMRISKWRSQLRQAYITHIDDIPVKTIKDIHDRIKSLRKQGKAIIKIGFATIEKVAIQAQKGTPQIYHDQLNIIGQHLYEINNDIDTDIYSSSKSSVFKIQQQPNLNKTKGFRRYELKLRPDWQKWLDAEKKQLDQYTEQGMFSDPILIPEGSNVLSLLWVYLIKPGGKYKARCVCNGSKRMTGTVTLAETYAGSLDQTSSKIFWAAVAVKNYIVIGADAANAFGEAPAPVAPPLYKNRPTISRLVVTKRQKCFYSKRIWFARF